MRPTLEELRIWHARMNFASMVSAAACLGIKVNIYKRWFYGECRPPALMRRVMQYVERFGKWEQIDRTPKELILAWQEKLPVSRDTEAKKKHSDRMRELRKRRKNLKSAPSA